MIAHRPREHAFLSCRHILQHLDKRLVEVVVLQAGRCNADDLAVEVVNIPLDADIPRLVGNGLRDRVQVVLLDLRRLVADQDLGAVATEGTERIALDLTAVLLSAYALVRVQLHRPVVPR